MTDYIKDWEDENDHWADDWDIEAIPIDVGDSFTIKFGPRAKGSIVSIVQAKASGRKVTTLLGVELTPEQAARLEGWVMLDEIEKEALDIIEDW